MNDRIEPQIAHGFETYWRAKPSRTGLHMSEQADAFKAGVLFGVELARAAKETPKKSEKRSEPKASPINEDREAGQPASE